MRRNSGNLKKLREGPVQELLRKQSYTHKELNPANRLNEPGRDSYSELG